MQIRAGRNAYISYSVRGWESPRLGNVMHHLVYIIYLPVSASASACICVFYTEYILTTIARALFGRAYPNPPALLTWILYLVDAPHIGLTLLSPIGSLKTTDTPCSRRRKSNKPNALQAPQSSRRIHPVALREQNGPKISCLYMCKRGGSRMRPIRAESTDQPLRSRPYIRIHAWHCRPARTTRTRITYMVSTGHRQASR